MKPNSAIAIILLFGLGNVYAACTNPYLTSSDVVTALNNKIVCSPVGCSSATGNCSWSEIHTGGSGGSIRDYKRGPGHATDPTDINPIGTWTVQTTGTVNGKVTYQYTGGHTGSYDVHDDGGGLYTFCNGPGSPITAKVIAGAGPCN